jgi:hypothetical protein
MSLSLAVDNTSHRRLAADLQGVRRAPERKYHYTSRIKSAEDTMNKLRIEMYGCDMHHMAQSIDVSYSCLMSIRSGRTIWPRPKTFWGIIDYLGLEVHLVRTTHD